jgi:hypothetical protein
VTLALLLLCACGNDAAVPQRFPFTFSAHSDGEPLASVRVLVGGRPIGTTNAQGLLQIDLTGPLGAPVQVNAACPTGHRSPAEPQVHNLRRVQSLDPLTQRRGIEVTFACPPERREAVVVVRTHDQNGVPVFLDGREAARTDESGAAHLHVAMAPGTTFQVMLDTRFNERLRPRSPSQSFTLPDADEVFVLDQRFEQEAPPRRRRVVRPPTPPAPRLPIRIPSNSE